MPKRPLRRRARAHLGLALAVALGFSGCQATGTVANGYFDFGGSTFTTNPGSIVPYSIGYYLFFIAAIPLDLFSAIATTIGWGEGRGDIHDAAALAPSYFLGVTGGILLGAPFFPFGLPWWDPERADDEASPAKQAERGEERRDGRSSDRGSSQRGSSDDDINAGGDNRDRDRRR